MPVSLIIHTTLLAQIHAILVALHALVRIILLAVIIGDANFLDSKKKKTTFTGFQYGQSFLLF